ncbi:MAG TPA: hypothetical protein VLB07_00945 [Woeseiaceae bacterium]|nr:hypothetical protein [Woeseiaceae bacterium]
MKAGILLGSIILLGACAAPTEKQIEAREYRDAERMAKFLEIRQRCRDSGGILVVQGLEGRVGKGSMPRGSDQVRCQRSLALR